MVGEMTDAAIGEQAVIIVRWVGEDRQVHEEFVGLYSVPQTEAGTITAVITEVFVRLKQPTLNKLVESATKELAT